MATLAVPVTNGKQWVRAVIIDEPQAGTIVSYPLDDAEQLTQSAQYDAAFEEALVAARSMATSAEALTASIDALRGDVAAMLRRLDESS